ncbi:formin, putative [Trypanosoma brucei gambiense DAL972]|uniref:Formin, putative n=1 Tax=Trypanosoma brucei gambiense (strain MHOM/CI/86/DAL972) TaxID=679716 RepID=C9ZP58_TRYB9|nr:formin, putative [Trypanosoma brucei gambiense DAL972]CBH11186.1 formin, putative [Trypanosoma brucei gambiense DAL972]|eukprot:XP_011773473.1 formin, putative [Trypanosoma brucei gambiense DAL972]
MQRAQILKAGAVCAGRRERCSATSSASSGSSPKTNSSGTLQVCRGRQRTVSEAPSTPGSEGIRFGVQGSLRRFWNSRSQSGKPIATDASVDGKCTNITTDEVKVPSSVSVSSPIHVCDDVVTTKGDCGLVCTGTQTSVEFCRHLSLQQCGVAVEHGVDSSLHSEGLLPKLRYGSRRMVKRLMRRLRLPSTWEATLIHSLNEARGNPHTVAAALTKQLDSSCGKLVLLPPITAVGGENLECCRTQYNTQRTDEVPRVQGGEGVSDEITHSPVRRMDGAPPLTVGEVSGAQPNKQRAFPLQTTNASAEDSNLSACVSGNTPEGPARPSFGGLDLDTGAGAVGRKGSIVGTPSGSSENQPGDANKTLTLRTKGASTAASGGLPLRAPRVGEDFQLQEVCKVNAPSADGSLRTDSIFQLPGLSCRETPSCEQSLPKAGLELSLSTDNKEASRMEGVGGAYFSGGKGGACPSEKFWTSSRSVDEANPVDPFATDGTLNRAVLQKTAFATPLTPSLISAAATEEGCVPPPPTLSVGTTEDKGIPSLPPPPPPPPPPVRGKVPENRRCCKTRSVPIDKTQHIAGSSAFCTSEPVNLPGDFFQILAEEFKLAESSSTRKAPGLVAETIVSTDREKNVGVVLRVLRLPVSTIEECVRSFDDDTLSEECVASLAKVIPTKEERRLVESWVNQDPAVEACKLHRLSTVSQFFVMCVSVDLYAERIECWNMRNEFNCRVEDLEQKLKRAHDGIRAALDTKRLPRVLQYILAIGNFLNAGSRYEDAKGFSISQLDQIIQFPTTDRKRTLLEHAVMVVERCEPDLHRFTQELLPKVEYAGGFDTVGVTSEIRYLRERLEKCVTLVHTIAEDKPWTSKLDPFLRSALPAMERIEQHHSDLEAVSEELAIFFCEDPKTFPMNKVMRCLSSFAKRYDGKRALLQGRKMNPSKNPRRAIRS